MRSAICVIKANWNNKRITLDMVIRDFKLQYLGSVLGKYWNFLYPLSMILIYTFVFSIVMKAKLGGLAGGNRFAFVVYLCCGLLPWNAFSDCTNRGTRAFLNHAHLIKKVSFPAEILQTIVAGSVTINFLLAFGIYLIVVLFVGYGFSEHILIVPAAYLLQIVFSMGLGMFLSVLNVFFRDVEQLVNVAFMVWFWATPIVYEVGAVPEKFRLLIYMNPYYYFVNLYHKAIFYKVWPEAFEISIAVIIALTAFVIGASVLLKFKQEIPDEI